MSTFAISFLRLISLTALISFEFVCGLGTSSGQAQCALPPVANGRAATKSRGHLLRYFCSKGYQLYGPRLNTCVGKHWAHQHPVCVRGGCASLQANNDLNTRLVLNRAIAVFSCQSSLLTLVGGAVIYCDGHNWNATVPHCAVDITESTPCLLQNQNLCGFKLNSTGSNSWLDKDHFMMTITSSSDSMSRTSQLLSRHIRVQDEWSDVCVHLWVRSNTPESSLTIKSKTGNLSTAIVLHVFEENWREEYVLLPLKYPEFQLMIECFIKPPFAGFIEIRNISLSVGKRCHSKFPEEFTKPVGTPTDRMSDTTLVSHTSRAELYSVSPNTTQMTSSVPTQPSLDPTNYRTPIANRTVSLGNGEPVIDIASDNYYTNQYQTANYSIDSNFTGNLSDDISSSDRYFTNSYNYADNYSTEKYFIGNYSTDNYQTVNFSNDNHFTDIYTDDSSSTYTNSTGNDSTEKVFNHWPNALGLPATNSEYGTTSIPDSIRASVIDDFRTTIRPYTAKQFAQFTVDTKKTKGSDIDQTDGNLALPVTNGRSRSQSQTAANLTTNEMLVKKTTELMLFAHTNRDVYTQRSSNKMTTEMTQPTPNAPQFIASVIATENQNQELEANLFTIGPSRKKLVSTRSAFRTTTSSLVENVTLSRNENQSKTESVRKNYVPKEVTTPISSSSLDVTIPGTMVANLKDKLTFPLNSLSERSKHLYKFSLQDSYLFLTATVFVIACFSILAMFALYIQFRPPTSEPMNSDTIPLMSTNYCDVDFHAECDDNFNENMVSQL